MRISYSGFIILLLTAMVAAKPVGRVESLQGDKKLFRQETASSPFYRSHIEQDAEIGHHFRTDANSMASIRFFLGGNVGLGKDCEIVVVNERDAKILSQGNYWMKFDKQNSDAPIRIQTAGGVMGIRGTEFVLKVDEDGATEMSLLEGVVEVEATDGDTLVAEPGMRVNFGGGQGLRYKLYKVEQLLNLVEEDLGPEFLQLREALQETRQAVRDAKLQIRTATAESRAGLLSARLGAIQGKRALRDSGLSDESLDGVNANLNLADSILARLEGGDPGEDDPNSGPGEATPPAGLDRAPVGSHPSLQWPGPPEQTFTVLILEPEDDSRVLWVAETRGPSYTHPEDAEPLAPGPYTFRVVPTNAEGRYEDAVDFPIQVVEQPE